MRKNIFVVALATLVLGNPAVLVAANGSEVASVTVNDSTVTDHQGNSRKAEVTRNLVGGLIGSFLGNSNPAQVNKDTLRQNVSKGIEAKKNDAKNAVGNMIGSFLSNSANKAQQATDTIKKDVTEKVNERQNETRNAVGGLIGSFLGKGGKNTGNGGASHSGSGLNLGNGSKVGGILGSVIGGVAASSAQLTAEKLVGTWNYTSSKCVLESDDVMKKMGGEMVVAPLEKKLNKGLERVGFVTGSFSYTFNEDGTFTSNLKGRKMSGKYVLDTENKTVTLTYVGGLLKSTMAVTLFNNQLGLLYDSDKLLNLVSGVASMSSSATIKSLNTILKSYDGLKVGLEFTR